MSQVKSLFWATIENRNPLIWPYCPTDHWHIGAE